MKLLGAEVVPIESGTKTLKDAINAALRYWIAEQRTTHYCFGTAAGPHPFPLLVREFQAVISLEARGQCLEKMGRLPDYVVACVGGGSNAIGMFHHFVPDASVKLIGVEAGGTGEPGCYHSAPLNLGTPRRAPRHALHAAPDPGRPDPAVPFRVGRPGLSGRRPRACPPCTPAAGPTTMWWWTPRRWPPSTSCAGARASSRPSKAATAVAWAIKHAAGIPKGSQVVVCLSGRGDKDLGIIEDYERNTQGVSA